MIRKIWCILTFAKSRLIHLKKVLTNCKNKHRVLFIFLISLAYIFPSTMIYMKFSQMEIIYQYYKLLKDETLPEVSIKYIIQAKINVHWPRSTKQWITHEILKTRLLSTSIILCLPNVFSWLANASLYLLQIKILLQLVQTQKQIFAR